MEMTAALSIGLAFVSIIITVSIPIVGFAYKTLSERIRELKTDAKAWINDEERRRNEAIHDVTALVNSHYNQLRVDLAEIKQDLRNIRNDVE